MNNPRPESRWTFASTGNRLLYAVAAALTLSWLTGTTGMLRVGVFLAVTGLGYWLLTLLHTRTTDTPKETP